MLLRRRWRDENEFFDGLDERRQERSRGCFIGSVDTVGSSTASSAQLKQSETRDFGGFRVKMGENPMFSCFFMKPTVAERVLRSVATSVSAGGMLVLSARFDWSETIDSRVFWVNLADFSTFW